MIIAIATANGAMQGIRDPGHVRAERNSRAIGGGRAKELRAIARRIGVGVGVGVVAGRESVHQVPTVKTLRSGRATVRVEVAK